MANSVKAAVLQTRALMAFLSKIARQHSGQALKLPKIANWQHLAVHLIDIFSLTGNRHDSVDFFGNTVSAVTHKEPHKKRVKGMSARVNFKGRVKHRDFGC